MAQTVSVSTGGPGNQYSLINDEDILVLDGVQIFSENGTTIFGTGRNTVFLSPNSAVLAFSGLSFDQAVELGATSNGIGGHNVTIAASASLQANHTALDLQGTVSTVTNNGLISGSQLGVVATGRGNNIVNFGNVTGIEGYGIWAGERATITNFGTIFGDSRGVYLEDGGGKVTNTGEISGRFAVYLREDEVLSAVSNSGTIIGSSCAVYTASGSDTIINSGILQSSANGVATIAKASGVSSDRSHLLRNSGDILSEDIAYVGSDGTDRIVNTGLIDGDIELAGGNDVYHGANGRLNGTVFGENGADTIFGGANHEALYGGNGHDLIHGRDGDDDIFGGSGNDDLRGGAGRDRIDAASGNNTLYGHADSDSILGGNGIDDIYGGGGNDRIDGGKGRDTIDGGVGQDILTGSGGRDFFVFQQVAGDDRITDFVNNVDWIDISAFGLRSTQYGAVVAPALSNAGSGATLLDLEQLGGSGSVIIQGLALGAADASDFIF